MAEDTDNLKENEEQEVVEEKVENSPEEPKEESKEESKEAPKKDPLVNRVKNLADRTKTAEKENEKLTLEREEMERERDFFKSFSDSVAQYPEAKGYEDAIKEKVMSGYSVEDATITVLAKEGKFGDVELETPTNTIGGSASTPPSASGEKSLKEMTRDEKREALVDAEARGDLSLN